MSFLKKKGNKQIQKEIPLPGSPKESEEDGFVLIGETEEEMKALTPDKQNPSTDPPPNYEMSVSHYGNREPSSKMPQCDHRPSYQQGPNVSDQRTYQRTPKSPLFDVPFKLDDSVACALSHGHINVDIGDELSWSTSQYDYDFSVERSIMQQNDF